jgi:hypothetical protein
MNQGPYFGPVFQEREGDARESRDPVMWWLNPKGSKAEYISPQNLRVGSKVQTERSSFTGMLCRRNSSEYAGELRLGEGKLVDPRKYSSIFISIEW